MFNHTHTKYSVLDRAKKLPSDINELREAVEKFENAVDEAEEYFRSLSIYNIVSLNKQTYFLKISNTTQFAVNIFLELLILIHKKTEIKHDAAARKAWVHTGNVKKEVDNYLPAEDLEEIAHKFAKKIKKLVKKHLLPLINPILNNPNTMYFDFDQKNALATLMMQSLRLKKLAKIESDEENSILKNSNIFDEMKKLDALLDQLNDMRERLNIELPKMEEQIVDTNNNNSRRMS